jgi:hypothetical protein
MSSEGNQRERSYVDLGGLRRAFDAACQELGIGIEGLDVPKRERLVECIIRLTRQKDNNADALQKRAVVCVKSPEQRVASKA